MSYAKHFDPRPTELFPAARADAGGGDLRDGSVYVYSDDIVLAVNVALATGRPLLVRGPSGSGKSTLARNVARTMGWRYYEDVISSRTQARDLLWRFDTLRRLNDAAVNQLKAELHPYIDPGVLWWAFDRESARRRGAPEEAGEIRPASEPAQESEHARAMVLLDEIDKADPDVPNNLLVPLGSLEFTVTEIDRRVRAEVAPLIFITTNEERELPPAFVRRCIVLTLQGPDEERLVEIARAHFGWAGTADRGGPDDEALYRKIASLVLQPSGRDRRASPSTAEFLDAVRACKELEVDPDHALWAQVAGATLWKPRETLAGTAR
jgi:MoxR-like ATPase